MSLDKLYHYTQREARDGICDKNIIWFKLTSESRNDNRETIYIREVLDKIIKQYRGNNYFFSQAIKVMNSVLNPVAPENLRCYIEKNIFMFCLMNVKNDQAGKEFYNQDTEVYRIEFDKQRLINYFKRQNPRIENYGLFMFGNMIYDEKEQIKTICSIIKKFEEAFIKFNKHVHHIPLVLDNPSLASTPTNDYSGISGYQPALNESLLWYPKAWEKMSLNEKLFIDKLWTSLANEFYKVSTFIKDPSFEKKEKEYRVAFFGKPDFEKYKPVNRFHCIEFSIDNSLILNDVIV